MSSTAVDKGIPVLREWELNENSTRYDQSLAAPSDETLVKFWIVWAILALVGGLFVLVVFLSILSSKKARQDSFNLYLLFLMVPDLTFSLLCGMTCLMNAIHGSYWSHWMCNFQQWYCVWAIGSNCWLNAIITYQLHSLLKCSHLRQKFHVPSPRTIRIHATAVYLCCAFLGTWGLFENASNFPFHSHQSKGLACIPVEMDTKSTIFFWIIFMPLFSLIPLGYVIYATYDILYKSKLLPPSGRRRALAVYFGRIIFIFLLFWGPYFLMNYLLATWMPIQVSWIGGALAHFQGPISAGLSMHKPDIYKAVKRFMRCQCWNAEEKSPSSSSSSSSISSSSSQFHKNDSKGIADAQDNFQSTRPNSVASASLQQETALPNKPQDKKEPSVRDENDMIVDAHLFDRSTNIAIDEGNEEEEDDDDDYGTNDNDDINENLDNNNSSSNSNDALSNRKSQCHIINNAGIVHGV